MAQVVFEYTDEHGRTRRVRKISDVPRQHLGSMVAIGQEEAAPSKAPAGSLSLPFTPPVSLDFLQRPATPLIVGAAGLLLWLKTRNFMLKLLLATVAGMWLFLRGYDRMMSSELLKPYEKPSPARSAPGP